ncbi:MAG: NUDIX hydrolase [Eubacteriales bacterium]|nr:NUDIX hydrolase [Eubacteriales bacterium]
MELNDVYDENRNPTGRVHRRGEPWQPGEYGVAACVWVYDGRGRYLLTRRARGKSFAGTWENSGGAVKAGETSLQAVARELYEETGIRAGQEEFEYLDTDRDKNMFYDHYCLRRRVPLDKIVLLPGETDDVMWASGWKVRRMIAAGSICAIIGQQFRRLEPRLRLHNLHKFGR